MKQLAAENLSAKMPVPPGAEAWFKTPQQLKEMWLSSLQMWQGILVELIAETVKSDGPLDAEDESRLSSLIADPAFQFLLRVAFPCWLQYGDTATRLLFRARHVTHVRANARDMRSLKALARLDKRILFEPRIAKNYQRAVQIGSPLVQQFVKALELKPRLRFTVPVYLGDAVQWKREAEDLFTGGHLVIETDDDRQIFESELRFPDQLLQDPAKFGHLVEAMANLAGKRKPGAAVPRLTGIFQRFAISPAARTTLQATFETLCKLHDDASRAVGLPR